MSHVGAENSRECQGRLSEVSMLWHCDRENTIANMLIIQIEIP